MSGLGVGIPVPQGWRKVDAGHASGDGVFWDFAVDGATATIETPTFEAGYIYRVIQEDVRISLNSVYRYFGLYDGSTWTTGSGFGYSASAKFFSAVLDLFDPSDASSQSKIVALSMSNTPLAGGAGTDDFFKIPAISLASSTAATKARFTLGGGNHNGGKFKLYRMRM